jgi:hypothetical protein
MLRPLAGSAAKALVYLDASRPEMPDPGPDNRSEISNGHPNERITVRDREKVNLRRSVDATQHNEEHHRPIFGKSDDSDVCRSAAVQQQFAPSEQDKLPNERCLQSSDVPIARRIGAAADLLANTTSPAA